MPVRRPHIIAEYDDEYAGGYSSEDPYLQATTTAVSRRDDDNNIFRGNNPPSSHTELPTSREAEPPVVRRRGLGLFLQRAGKIVGMVTVGAATGLVGGGVSTLGALAGRSPPSKPPPSSLRVSADPQSHPSHTHTPSLYIIPSMHEERGLPALGSRICCKADTTVGVETGHAAAATAVVTAVAPTGLAPAGVPAELCLHGRAGLLPARRRRGAFVKYHAS